MNDIGIMTEFPRPVREIENAWIPMADGCRLAARIWLPADAEAHPVPAILEYIPYRKRDGTAVRDQLTHPYFAGHGYVAVRVDMRGNGDSDGLMADEYAKQEQDDAMEAIAWIAGQPWCTGAVGMIGISWGGFNGLQLAALRPSALKAVITLCSTDDRYADDIHYKGGCLINENLGWASTLLCYSSRPPDPMLAGDGWRATWLERLEHQPLLADTWLRHPHRDAYWRHGSVSEDWKAIEAATLCVGGWGDAYSNAIPRLMRGLQVPRKAIIGPWVHKYPHFAPPGPRIGFLQEALRWWDRWLKGQATGVEREPAFRVYLMESVRPKTWYGERKGRWLALDAWPAPEIVTRRLHLNATGLEPRAKREQALRVCSPQTTGLHGGEYCIIWLGPEHPGDQRADDAGSLVFDSSPLEQATDIVGQPVVELEFAADRPVAFVAVRLCDVWPDGASTRITYQVMNLCHRDGHARPKALRPGRRYRVPVALDDIAYAVPKGHRLRVAISTAYWPLMWPAPEPVTLTVFAGASRLLLPVLAARPRRKVRFARPEGAAPLEREELRAPSNHRILEHDQSNGHAVLKLTDDFGRYRIRSHGLVSDQVARESYSILPDDPLSAHMTTHWSEELARGDWSVRTETRAVLTADRTHFRVRARVEAFEGEERVHAKRWDEKIERQLG